MRWYKIIDSLDIAKKFKKSHHHVVRDIKNFLKKNPELSEHFFESEFISNGRHYFKFQIDGVGAEILTNKFKYNIRSARFEYKYLNEIEDFLKLMNINYVEQYQIDNYRIDLYISQYNIAIEIDEEEHKYQQEYDKMRQKYIENQIHCKFIRINEGENCGSVMAKIVKELKR